MDHDFSVFGISCRYVDITPDKNADSGRLGLSKNTIRHQAIARLIGGEII
jgi:hypothetical protein